MGRGASSEGVTEADERWMSVALKEAEAAFLEGEVPAGCVIVKGDRLLARAHNQTRTLHDPTAHAEMIAVTQAAAALGYERLDGCTVYATAEPCVMCAGALVLARVARVVYGCAEPKFGAAGSLYRVLSDARLNHRCDLTAGVLAADCAALLRRFFERRRAEQRNKNR